MALLPLLYCYLRLNSFYFPRGGWSALYTPSTPHSSLFAFCISQCCCFTNEHRTATVTNKISCGNVASVVTVEDTSQNGFFQFATPFALTQFYPEINEIEVQYTMLGHCILILIFGVTASDWKGVFVSRRRGAGVYKNQREPTIGYHCWMGLLWNGFRELHFWSACGLNGFF